MREREGRDLAFMSSDSDDHLLDVEFDLNPLKMKEDKQKIDQRIRLRLLPVQVVYDAVSLALYLTTFTYN